MVEQAAEIAGACGVGSLPKGSERSKASLLGASRFVKELRLPLRLREVRWPKSLELPLNPALQRRALAVG
jgi:hypothetical protein